MNESTVPPDRDAMVQRILEMRPDLEKLLDDPVIHPLADMLLGYVDEGESPVKGVASLYGTPRPSVAEGAMSPGMRLYYSEGPTEEACAALASEAPEQSCGPVPLIYDIAKAELAHDLPALRQIPDMEWPGVEPDLPFALVSRVFSKLEHKVDAIRFAVAPLLMRPDLYNMTVMIRALGMEGDEPRDAYGWEVALALIESVFCDPRLLAEADEQDMQWLLEGKVRLLYLLERNYELLAAASAFAAAYPSCPEAHYWLGEGYARTGSHSEAMKELTRSLEEGLEHRGYLLGMLAVCAEAMGDEPQRRKYEERGLAEDAEAAREAIEVFGREILSPGPEGHEGTEDTGE